MTPYNGVILKPIFRLILITINHAVVTWAPDLTPHMSPSAMIQ